jgi:hypothetical protein
MDRRRGGRRKNREAYMERYNYYFIFFFLDVGSDKAKSHFIFHISNILKYPRVIK